MHARINLHGMDSCEDYLLTIHADGYAVNKSAWTDEFFSYDYIGAVWHQIKHSWWSENLVGNGGFSLRSQKLLQGLKTLQIPIDPNDFPGTPLETSTRFGATHIPEDVVICRWYRQTLVQKFGIRFAPPGLADQFCIENHLTSPWLGKSLGFHGKHGVHEFYDAEI